MCEYLRTKFQVSSIILASFRQGRGGGRVILPPHARQNGPLKSPPRLGLIISSWWKLLKSDPPHLKRSIPIPFG